VLQYSISQLPLENCKYPSIRISLFKRKYISSAISIKFKLVPKNEDQHLDSSCPETSTMRCSHDRTYVWHRLQLKRISVCADVSFRHFFTYFHLLSSFTVVYCCVIYMCILTRPNNVLPEQEKYVPICSNPCSLSFR